MGLRWGSGEAPVGARWFSGQMKARFFRKCVGSVSSRIAASEARPVDPLDDKKKWRIVAHLSTAPATLAVAERLRKLAGKTADHPQDLLAAAIVAAATALAQCLDMALSVLAGNEWGDRQFDTRDLRKSSLSELFNLTLRQKTMRLPGLLSNGRLRLRKGHELTRALNHLIDRRHELVHIAETPRLLEGDDSSVRFTEDNHLELAIPVPKHPWQEVTQGEADRCIEAVRTYMEQVASVKVGSESLFRLPYLELVNSR